MSKMKLACVFSKSIHECGCSVGNCTVCADLMEKRKTLSIILYGTEALSREESTFFKITPSCRFEEVSPLMENMGMFWNRELC